MVVHMANMADTPPSLLAGEITKRLVQLKISRREFVRRTGLSRQTLHNVEREGVTDLWPTTFHALDLGLEWPTGTAQELAKGNASAISSVLTIDERLAYLRNDVMQRIADMDLEKLEALVGLMEGQVFGKVAKTTAEHIAMVEKRLAELEALLGIQHGGSEHIAG